MKKNTILILIVIGVVIWGGIIYLLFSGREPSSNTNTSISNINLGSSEMKKFASAQEYKSYLEESMLDLMGYYDFGFAGTTANVTDDTESFQIEDVGAEVGLGTADLSAPRATGPSRVSRTNVQVLAIDEPDYVKTDGKNIFYSPEGYSYYDWGMRSSEEPDYPSSTTKVIKAFPVADLKKLSEISQTGEMLLSDNILIIFSGRNIYGYDVSDNDSPKEVWRTEIDSKSQRVSSRLYNGKIYLVSSTYAEMEKPCPIEPLKSGGDTLSVACAEIYHPIAQAPVNVTYTASVINPKTGKIEKNVSFVGSTEYSVIYMSANALYVTYTYNADYFDIFAGFMEEEGKAIFPQSYLEKIKKLNDYDISAASKYTEMGMILSRYMATLTDEETTKLSKDMEIKMTAYLKRHQREFSKTSLVKISLDNFSIQANGLIPGVPLNQFSLDEHKGNLRVATTSGSGWWSWGGSEESVNDVYVLDEKLKQVGSILNLGKGERIYSARFVGDKGYLVTFRETDPFYVLDLSNPKNPEMKGELKIPGYSSYLHPLKDNLILGVGKEESKVKISLFDVSNPANPVEKDKYTLDEYWTDLLNTHHAFLNDEKYEVFFMPGSKGAYIFSYKGDKLSLAKTVTLTDAKRAVYIDDYLYLIASDKIVVLDQKTWEESKSLSF